MATKGKAAAKAAPAPAAEEVIEVGVGTQIVFLGYDETVPEEDRFLTENTIYEVVEIDAETGNPLVEIENPHFDKKKKEHPDTNPKLVQVDLLPTEFEIATEEDLAGADGAVEEQAEAAAPAPAPAPSRAKATPPAAKTATKPATKTAAKPAAAPKGKQAEEAEEPTDPDALPDLDNEDPDVVAIVEQAGEDGLIAAAQELDQQVGQSEWQLGGLLFHIRKAKAHHTLKNEKGKVIKDYQENGGFEKFVQEYFNIEYRKAMYLIEIYKNFTLAGIENPAEVVARIGWTKAQKIAKPLLLEDANATELVELAETSTAADLSVALKEQVTVGATKTGGEKKKRTTFKLRMFEEEAASAEAILERVKEELGVKDIADAFMHILAEYEANSGGEAAAEEAPAQRAAARPAAAKPAARKTAKA